MKHGTNQTTTCHQMGTVSHKQQTRGYQPRTQKAPVNDNAHNTGKDREANIKYERRRGDAPCIHEFNVNTAEMPSLIRQTCEGQ